MQYDVERNAGKAGIELNLLFGCSWSDACELFDLNMPKPELVVELSQLVYAAEVTIEYPAGVIDVLDSYETTIGKINGRALVWHEDDETGGVLTVHAASSADSFSRLSMVFELETTTVLNPANVVVTVSGAWDQNGNPIAGVTAAVDTIL